MDYTNIEKQLSRLEKSLTNILKSEDLINLNNANDSDKNRYKNIGGQGLKSMPKAGKSVDNGDGSGGGKPKLGKDEMALTETCSGCKGKSSSLCKMCKGTGKPVKKSVGSFVTGLGIGMMQQPIAALPQEHKEVKPLEQQKQPDKTTKAEVPAAKPPGAGGSPKLSAKSKVLTAKPPKAASTSTTSRVSVSTSVMKNETEKQFEALRIKHMPASMSKAELLSGAAHHLNGLNKSISYKDEVSASQHANMLIMYERLMGNNASWTGPSAETEKKAEKLVKFEFTGYKGYSKDAPVEELFKALLGLLPKNTELPANAPNKTLPGVKGPAGNFRSIPISSSVKPAQSLDFNRPNGVPASTTQSSVKPADGPTGANPLIPKPQAAGSVLARIRSGIFGSRTSAVAPPVKTK